MRQHNQLKCKKTAQAYYSGISIRNPHSIIVIQHGRHWNIDGDWVNVFCRFLLTMEWSSYGNGNMENSHHFPPDCILQRYVYISFTIHGRKSLLTSTRMSGSVPDSVICRLYPELGQQQKTSTCEWYWDPFVSHPLQVLYLRVKICEGSWAITTFDSSVLAKQLATF